MNKSHNLDHNFLHTNQVPKVLLSISLLFTLIYTTYILFLSPPGNKVIFILLVLTQLFFAFQSISYIYTIWDTRYLAPRDNKFKPWVDIFITVCGEPTEIVEETLKAMQRLDYPNYKIYLLNDGYVAGKENWQEVEKLAERYGVNCITRKVAGGNKAGNINNALKLTDSPFIACFDVDHIPHPDFLSKTVGYFADPKMAFVQTPQFYKNNDANFVTETAWDQQALFFGALCKGKNRLNSTFMCGTNMVIRRSALIEVGGMCENNIAEDFLTSLFIHKNGWKSTYVPEVLAEGLAPEHFLSYYKQQFRWTRGSLEVIFKYNPLFSRGLTWAQKIQYLASASYYLTGMVVLINILLPMIYFYTGQVPLVITTMQLAFIFLPYILINIYVLQISSGYSYTFKALCFSVSSFILQIQGVFTVLLNRQTKFNVTSKTQIKGNFLYLVLVHILYVLLVGVGIAIAYRREGFSASLFNNASWALLFIIIFSHFIYAAAPKFKIVPKIKPNSKIDLNENIDVHAA
jgi:cellulose synthase (UDP-forming)